MIRHHRPRHAVPLAPSQFAAWALRGSGFGPVGFALLVLGCGEIIVPADPDTSSSGDEPVFTNPGPQEAIEGVSFALQLGATDPGGGSLTYSLTGGPDDASVSPQGRFTWTPGVEVSTPAADQTVSVTVAATNAAGLKGTLTLDVTVLNNSDDDDQPDYLDDDDDNDGLTDVQEGVKKTDPTLPDTDGDTIGDAQDVCPTTADKEQKDTDGDDLGDACDPDDDDDGVLDSADNCALVANPPVAVPAGDDAQTDLDEDGLGDACDPDADGDDVVDEDDNCPGLHNPGGPNGQSDINGDGEGDACDPDDDGDLVPDVTDNCPAITNADQGNNDVDSLGDICDPDDDNDGVADDTDNCPLVFQANQKDTDGDLLGDECDVCVSSVSNVDADSDGVCDDDDNCLGLQSGDQTDTDGDGQGNPCDTDDDDDTVLDVVDNCDLVVNTTQTDCDGDDVGDACEVDDDDDGRPDEQDNCICIPNPDQADCEQDGIGDACDPDIDGDAVPDSLDNCPGCNPNPDQQDTDQDDQGDYCDLDDDGDLVPDVDDNCPFRKNPDQTNSDEDPDGDECDLDDDEDGREDGDDNCRTVDNVDQADLDLDGAGDACDPDDDGDGRGDDVDNCRRVANPNQTDLDQDAVGDVCDAVLRIPSSVASSNESVRAHSRGGVTALAFGGPLPCGASPACGTAGYAVIDLADYAAIVPDWVAGMTGLGDAHVSGDRAAYFSATGALGNVTITRVVSGDSSTPFITATQSLPTLLDVLDGSVLQLTNEGANAKVTQVFSDKPAVTHKTALAFRTSLNDTPFVADNGLVFVPYEVSASGSKFSVMVFGPEGAKTEPLLPTGSTVPNATSLGFEFIDRQLGTPWWCVRRSGQTELVHTTAAATPKFSQTVPASDCGALWSGQADTGDVWYDATKSAVEYEVGRIDPSGVVPLARRYFACDPTVYLIGKGAAVVADCGNELYDLVDAPAGTFSDTWTFANINGYGLTVARNTKSGRFVAAFRTNKSLASPVEARLVGDGIQTIVLTHVASMDKPTIQGLWVTREGHVFAQILGRFDPANPSLNSTVLVSAGPSVGTRIATTKGYAEIFETELSTLLAHNGADGPGLYLVIGSSATLVQSAFVDGSAARPVVLGDTSTGHALVFLQTSQGGSWSLFDIDPATKTSTAVLTGLVAPPLSVDPTTDGKAFVFESGQKLSHALVRSDGTLVVTPDFTELVSLRGADGLAWGYRGRSSFTSEWTVCRLGDPNACVTVPTAAFLVYEAVDDGGLYHALWFDESSVPFVPTLFRSFELP
ncbi:MAG: thrombospondin type 3 repeat-containing protein [Myxococcales bacterium]|nr:thrombospondin type 3 repeat-containing protein [Myxococcales bacterium]